MADRIDGSQLTGIPESRELAVPKELLDARARIKELEICIIKAATEIKQMKTRSALKRLVVQVFGEGYRIVKEEK